MVTKILKKVGIFSILLTLTACPAKEDCNDLGRTIDVADLEHITPLQQVYNQGDVIAFSIEIPRVFQGVDLLDETGDRDVLLVLSDDDLFVGNELVFQEGRQGASPNWFYLTYNEQEQLYQLKINITFNRIGEYNMFTERDSCEFVGDECNVYRIDTSIEGAINNRIQFTVN